MPKMSIARASLWALIISHYGFGQCSGDHTSKMAN